MFQLTINRLPIVPLAALLLLGAASGARAQQPEFVGDPGLLPEGHSVRVNVDLRELPAPPQWRPGDPIKTIPRRIHPRSPDDMPAVSNEQKRNYVDPLVETQTDATRSAAPESGPLSLVHNFEGSTFSGVYPPDPAGEPGLANYVQMINHSTAGSQVRFYDKVTGVEVANFALQSLAPPGSGCSDGLGDPIALFDHLADRWFLSEFANDPPNALCLYISQTSDPLTGGWFHYQINTTTFPDYPKYSVWPDAYYVNTNESAHTNYALDRENMLLGLPIRPSIRRTLPCLDGWLFCTTPPIDLDGPAPPPGTPGLYIRQVDDELHCALGVCVPDPLSDYIEIWEFTTDWLVPANSTLVKAQEVPTAEFDSLLCDIATFRCVPQPVPNPLDPLREAVMWKPQYRNFGTHESIVGNFVTDVTGTDYHGVRWFELRRTGGGAWSVYQEGTFSGLSQDPADVEHRWMAGSGMDGFGNIGLAYSVSSQATFPGIRFTGREAADPLGAMTHGDNTLIEGSGPSLPFERWGDYHAMAVDPVDDCTFWFTGMHSQDLTGDWTTQVGAFRFPACAGDVELQAVADSANTPQDTPVVIPVLANDVGEGISIDSVDDPPAGMASHDGTLVTYTPDPGVTGQDMFDYTITDGVDFSTATITVNVELVSCAAGGSFLDDFEPDAEPGWLVDTVTTPPTSPAWAVTADTGAQSPTNAFFTDNAGTVGGIKDDRLISPPQALTATSQLTFWHHYQTEDTYDGGVLEVCDTSDDCGNDANWQDITAAGGTFVQGGYDAAIDDCCGNPLQLRNAWTGLSSAHPTMHQTIVNLGGLGGGEHQFRWRFGADDINIEPGLGWWVDDVAFTNLAVNCDPVAAPDTAETTIDTPVEIDVLANDSDPNGDPLDIDTVTDPPNGSAVLNDNDPAPDTITYTPDPGFIGSDNFAYSVIDGQGGSATGTVTVTVSSLESCTFGAPLFADSFEGGDFSAWTSTGGRLQNPQGDLTVAAPPTALDGALAMSVALNHNPPGDEEVETWVTAKHQAVSNYCWSFWLDTSELTMAEGRLLKIWGARASDNQRLLDLALRRNTAGAATTWALGLKVWRDNLTGKKLPFADIPDGKVLVAGEWSTTGEGGVLRLYVNGVLLDELTGVVNVNRLLTTPGMGNLGLFKPGTVGTLYFDGFAAGWDEP